MAKFEKATRQETVLIQGSIIHEADFYWITDEKGNRVGLSWRKDYADRLTDALAVLEDIEGQEGR